MDPRIREDDEIERDNEKLNCVDKSFLFIHSSKKHMKMLFQCKKKEQIRQRNSFACLIVLTFYIK